MVVSTYNEPKPTVDKEMIENAPQILEMLTSADPRHQEILKSVDVEKVKKALDFILAHPDLSDRRKADLVENSWKLHYKSKPPTPEEFLTYKYIGEMCDEVYPRVKKWFLEFFDPSKNYRDAVLYPFIGAGKQGVNSSVVYTYNGPKKMGDMVVGDIVCTPDGASATVLGVFPQTDRTVYELTFSDGRTARVGKDHLWKASSTANAKFWNKGLKKYDYLTPVRNWKELTTQQIVDDYARNSKARWCIPLTLPVAHRENSHQISPYVLGALLGDGHLGEHIELVGNDVEIFDRVHLECLNNQIPITKYIAGSTAYKTYFPKTNSSLPGELQRLDLENKLSHSKFIPQEYLYDSVENRVALLQGLMDTDGSASKRGKSRFATNSIQLAKDVQELVRGLGGLASLQTRLRTRVYKGNIRETQEHVVSVQFPNNNIPVFSLKRKQERIDSNFNRENRNRRGTQGLFIKSIERVEDEDSTCIYVDHPDHLYLMDGYTVTHNTTLAVLINLYITVHLALMRSPKKLFNLATTSRLAFVLFSYNLEKAAEVLLEPFISLLEHSEFFERCRAMTLDTTLHGENGIILNRDVKVGDQIYDDQGILTSVLKVAPQGVTRVMRVTMADGRYVDTNPEHLWQVYGYLNRGKPSWKIMTTEEISKNRRYAWKIPLPKPVQFPRKDHSISPYILGMWLGDGCFSNYNITFASEEKDAMETMGRIREELPAQLTLSHSLVSKNKYMYQVIRSPVQKKKKSYDNPFLDTLKQLGLSDKKAVNKFIPEEYLRDSIENRVALLQGLMDSDGTSSAKHKKTFFSSISERLAQGVASLVRSLGGTAYVNSGKTIFRVAITFPNSDIVPFHLSRKQDAYLQRFKNQPRSIKNLGLTITHIEERIPEETQCITVSNDSHLFLCNDFIVTHNTKEDMIRKEAEFRLQSDVTKIYWTTASRNGIYALQFSNGINYKLASSPKDILGLTIVCGTMTELAFFREAGKSDEYIMRSFNDMKGRVWSRMKNTEISRFWGRTILDSSPNDLESPIDSYCMFDAEKDPRNYVVKGSHWQWVPEDYTPEELEDTFPIFRGGSGKPPRILSATQGIDASDIIWVPRSQQGISLYQRFMDDLVKSLKDLAGIPQGNLDKLFYDYDKIENCFVENLRSINYAMKADSRMSPFGLLWNQIKDDFFVRSGRAFHFWYKPKIPRVFHIDQSVSTDMTAIAFVHVERREGSLGNSDAGRDMVYVVDLVLPIHPMGGRINLDAIKEFIKDVYHQGGISIIAGSYDTYQSESALQDLERSGLEMEHISVDETMDPYIFLSQLIEQGNLKLGRNIFFKNNLKSLRITQTKVAKKMKVDHTSGDTVDPVTANSDWATSLMGINAKDISDAVAGAVYLAKLKLAQDGRSLAQVWQDDGIIVTPELLRKKVLAHISELGFAI